MAFRTEKIASGKLIVLFVLLLSLCTSRAEGVHLLPFADVDESRQSETFDDERLPFYQLSRTPEDPLTGIGHDISPDSDPVPISTQILEFDAAPVLLAAKSTGPDRSAQGCPVRWSDLLTSSSDRSPPTV